VFSDTGLAVSFDRDAQGRITEVVDPDGEVIAYEYDASGDLVAVTDREENTTQFVYDVEGRPHYLNEIVDPLGRSGVRTEYDEKGRLKRTIDVNGDAIKLTYNPDQSFQEVKDIYGEVTRYVYDEFGNVVTELDPTGRETHYKYEDPNNRTLETEVTVVTVEDGVELRRTTQHTYDAKGNKLTETDSAGNTTRYSYNRYGDITSVTDPLGDTISHRYDERGNRVETIDAEGNKTNFKYDSGGRLRFLTDANKETTEFQYEAFGNVKKVIDPLLNITEYKYNANGDRTEEKRYVTTATGEIREAIATWDYDKEGRVKLTVDPEQNEIKYNYDKNGNLISELNGRGYETKLVYDEKGQLVETIYPDNTLNNNEDNPRTVTIYDKGGRRRASIDEVGQVTHYVHDATGRLVETIYPKADNSGLSDLLDSLGLTGSTLADIDWTQVIYPTDLPELFRSDASNPYPRIRTEYNKAGEVKAEIDERGNRVEYRYDQYGFLVETIYPDDTPELDDNPRTTYTYDEARRRETVTDALNRTTTNVYDKVGRLKGVQFHDGTSIETQYDALGRQAATIDALGYRTEYEYDPLGRLTDVVQFINPGTSEEREIRTEYGYDELGRQIFQEDANDNRTQYEYDLAGRRTAVVLPLGQRSEMTYDGVGNILTEKDFNGEVKTYTYDPRNRLTLLDLEDDPDVSYTYTLTGLMKTVTDGRGITSYTYDNRDRLIGRVDPTGPYLDNGLSIFYTYDAASNRTSVETPGGLTIYEFDERNRLGTVLDSSQGLTTYKYDGENNLIEVTLPNRVVETRQYDELDRLGLLEQKLAGEVLASYNYELNDAGHRESVTEMQRQLDGTLITRTVEYDYDALYRLTEERFDSRMILYEYDDVGNRLEKNDSVDGVTTYVYDRNDRLESETTGGVQTSYTYDDNGNTKTKTTGVENTIYTWDDRNRLLDLQVPDSDAISYAYDDNNIRVSTKVGSTTTNFLVDGNRAYDQVLEEFVDGTPSVQYVYGLDLISQQQSGEQSVYLVDGLGSTRGLTDAIGEVASTYIYDAYGNLVSSTGTVQNNYLYTGEQFDSNVGHLYLRNRYYDPTTGRFTSRDIFEGFLTDPQSLAKYPYVHANPVNATDPSGLVLLNAVVAPSVHSNLIALSLISAPFLSYANTKSVPTVIAKALAESCALANDVFCRIDGYPLVFYGAADLREHSEHIYLAQLGFGFTRTRSTTGVSNPLPVNLLRKLPKWSRTWLKRREFDRNQANYIDRVGLPPALDEYPFASTWEGGVANYEANQVSVKAVSLAESNRQGNFMGRFYRRADIVANRPEGSFGVITLPYEYTPSFWIDRQGNAGR